MDAFNKEQNMKFKLYDSHHDDDTIIAGSLNVDSGNICLTFDGYGDCGTEDGYGCPLMIEYYDKELRVVVWDDINQEDPRIISLNGARENLRKS